MRVLMWFWLGCDSSVSQSGCCGEEGEERNGERGLDERVQMVG